MQVIDLSSEFHAALRVTGEKHLFQPSGHYTAAGNALVAREILAALRPVISQLRGR
jgi:hypothetical protein